MSRTLVSQLLLILGIHLTAAAAETEPSAPSEPAGLQGEPWMLIAYHSRQGLVEIAAQSRPTRFRFADGRLSGVTGCNSLTGGYTLRGRTFEVSQGLAATRMTCPPPVMAQEQAVIQALRAVTAFEHHGDRLDLRDARGRVLLRFIQPTPPPFANQVWTLRAYEGGKQDLVAPTSSARVTLQLDAQGRLRGHDGCNAYMSGYTTEDEQLSIGPIATTRMACRGGEALARQARDYAEALGKVASYRLSDQHLTLLDADGRPVLRFESEAPNEPPRGG